MSAPKLLSARASIRTALQSPQVQPFMPANNPDAAKVGSLAPKKKKKSSSLVNALTGNF